MYFNFGTVVDGAHQFTSRSDDVAASRPYVDGSIQKRFTFYLDNFKSVSYNPIVATTTDENLEEFGEIQSILDWVNAQDDLQNYPDFGEHAIIDKMSTTKWTPEMIGVDTTKDSPIAVYRIAIRIDYLDTSKRLWSNN